MKTITTKCPLTGTEKNYSILTEGVVYESYKNNFGNVVVFFTFDGNKVTKLGSMIAEENVNDLDEITDELQYSVGLSKDQSKELAEKVNQIFISLI